MREYCVKSNVVFCEIVWYSFSIIRQNSIGGRTV